MYTAYLATMRLITFALLVAACRGLLTSRLSPSSPHHNSDVVAPSSYTTAPGLDEPSQLPCGSTPQSLGVDPGGCENQTDVSERIIEAIKQNILNKLGMTRIPDMTGVNMTVAQRREILRLYRKSLEEIDRANSGPRPAFRGEDQFHANQFRSFTDNGERPSVLDPLPPSALTPSAPPSALPSTRRVYFAVDIPEPADPRQETVVKSAKLKLYKRSVQPSNLLPTNNIDRSVRIDIYQTVHTPPGGAGGAAGGGAGGAAGQEAQGPWLRRAIDSKLVLLDSGAGWEEFDVAPAVQEWIRDAATNYGLEIVTDTRYAVDEVIDWATWRYPAPAGLSETPVDPSYLPALDVLTQTRSILRRFQRSVEETTRPEDCVVGSGDRRCCRDRLVISFRDIGWHEWIIEPPSYTSYFCRGTCPPGHLVAHEFSRIKSLMIHADPSTTMSVQCTATRLSSLSIAHFNDQRERVISVLDDMFADRCMCA